MEKDSDHIPRGDGKPMLYERRSTDLLNESTRTRLAVLETSVAHHGLRIADAETYQRSTSTKLNAKIQEDTAAIIRIERTLASLSSVVEEMGSDLREASEAAKVASSLAYKHETIGATVVKVGSLITVIIGALWTIFKFLVDVQ